MDFKVKDLTPEHSDRFIGVRDVAVDHERVCWVLLDAPVFGADMRSVAPILIRRTRDAGYEVEMGGLSDDSNFTTIPSPDNAATTTAGRSTRNMLRPENSIGTSSFAVVSLVTPNMQAITVTYGANIKNITGSRQA